MKSRTRMDLETTYGRCCEIRNTILLRAAEAVSQDIGQDYRYYVLRLYDIHRNFIKFRVDPNDLTEKEMIDLGFQRWDTAYLTPLWLIPFIEEGIPTDAGYNFELKNVTIETRFGCVTVFFVPKDLK